jgi:hypothetical protein
LIWTIVEEFPFSYEIHQNGVLINEGYLTTNHIVQPLSSLSFGLHNYTILVIDGVGITDSFQTLVNVVLPPSLFASIVVSVGIFASAVVIVTVDFLRRKKKERDVESAEEERKQKTSFDISELLD